MDRQLGDWKYGVDRIWSADEPDYAEAVRLAEDIAGFSEQMLLRQAAKQALPSLRNAAAWNADAAATAKAARRRLRVVREVLHDLTGPHFGKREIGPKVLSAEERHRQLLGLPLDRVLSPAEIHLAYKHVAKRAHPDAGGSAEQFLELSAAREALMQRK